MAKLKIAGALERAVSLLERSGIPHERALISARCIVASDRWGIGSHGLMRLPFYLERLEAGGINSAAELRVVTDLPSLAIFDGENGLGHWQLYQAAQLAAERAQVQGIAAIGIGRSSHCGALGIYTAPITARGLVAIVFSNGPAVMPPWGGSKPVLSTSPIAAGIPSVPPTIIDLATSAVARGKIAAKAQLGEALEPGWAFTSSGEPTTDAKEALTGMLAPLGGAKGYALAVLVESLTGALIGPNLSKDIPDMFATTQAALPQEIAHFIIAIKADALSVDRETDRLQEFAKAVSESGGRLPGSSRVDPIHLDMSDEITVADSVMAQLDAWSERMDA